MKRYIHSDEILDEEIDDDYEFSPYRNGKYRVDAGYDTKWFDDPKKAIHAWFQGQTKHPMDVAIMTATRDNAIELVSAGTKEFLTKEYNRSPKCPYKLDYLIAECKRKVEDGCKYFYEGSYGYGDTVHPFGVG